MTDFSLKYDKLTFTFISDYSTLTTLTKMYHKPIQKSLSVMLATNLNAAHNMTNTNIYGQNKPL